MTVDSGVWKFARNFLISTRKKSWYSTHGSTYAVTIPRPPTGQQNRRVVVVDGPLWLYEFGNPLPNTVYPKTFEQLAASMAKKIEYYLQDPLVVGVVFMFDDEPPLAKQCDSSRNPSTHTPATPLELVPDFVGSRSARGIEAWSKWSTLPDQAVAGVRTTTQTTSSDMVSNVHRTDFKLPFSKPTKTSDPKLLEQLKQGTLKPPFFADYLLNRDFKRMLYKKLLEALCRLIVVPGNEQDKWVILQGTDYCWVRYPNGVRAKPDTELRIEYMEADTVIGHYMRLFMKEGFDVVIESVDGDVALCALMAMDDVITRTADMIQNVEFAQKVFQVRFRWSETNPTQVFDLCQLWKDIHTTFGAMGSTEGFQIENPIGTFVALAALLTNDYVRRYPQIGPNRLYKAVVRNAAVIFASGDLVHNHWRNPGEFKVNWETFKRLSVAAWTELASIKVNISRPDEAIAQLNNYENPASKAGFNMALVERTYANLTWCLRYFNTAGYATIPSPNEFSTAASGLSIYGYIKVQKPMDNFGSYSIIFAKQVDIEELKDTNNNHVQIAAPETDDVF